MSTAVLRALAGKPGAAKRVLCEEFGDTDLELSSDGASLDAAFIVTSFFFCLLENDSSGESVAVAADMPLLV